MEKIPSGLRDRKKLYEAAEKIWELEIDKDIKKELMNVLVWKIGETPNGKYKLKYRSKGAMNWKGTKGLNHEHVIPRKVLKEELINAKNKNEVNGILDKITTCIVTRKEHDLLKKAKGSKWKRYKSAEIKVFDMSTKDKRRVV